MKNEKKEMKQVKKLLSGRLRKKPVFRLLQNNLFLFSSMLLKLQLRFGTRLKLTFLHVLII